MSKKKSVSFSWAFREYIWPRKKMLGLGLILILIRSAAGLIVPYATKILLDEVVPSNDMQSMWLLLGVVAAAILVQASTSFGLTRLLSVQAQHMISQMRVQVQKKLMRLPIHFFDNNNQEHLYLV